MISNAYNLKILDGNSFNDLNTKVAVLIDVFRASTSIVVMLYKNVEEIIPFENEKKAWEYFEHHKDHILVGENNGIKIKGFHYGNSPTELMNAELNKKKVIFVSTNGTRVLKKIRAETIFIASFLNADAIVKYIPNDAVLVCSNRIDFFAIEDFLCASYIKSRKLNINIDFVKIKNTILKSKSALRLKNMNAENDIEFSLRLNQIPIIPIYENGRIIKGVREE